MTRLIGQTLPLQRIADTQVQNLAPGSAEIAYSITGRTRWLAEYSTGAVATDNQPCAPRVGLGQGPGHQHAGGIMAVPIQRTFGLRQFGFIASSLPNTTNGEAPQVTVDSGTTSQILWQGHIRTTRVSMCRDDGAYTSVDCGVVVRASAACTVTVEVTNLGHTVTFDETLAANTTTHILASAENKAILMLPGYYNSPRVKVTVDYIAATATCAILAIGFHQAKSAA